MNDTTFIVFNSGAYEIIGIRDRAKQTLYLTSVVETTATSHYGEMHTGLFLAAIRDAKERSLRFRKSDPHPNSWTVSYGVERRRAVNMVRTL
jgi:hypothetical protein